MCSIVLINLHFSHNTFLSLHAPSTLILGKAKNYQKFSDRYNVSGKLPTYPSPKPKLTLTSHLEQTVDLGEG